MDVLEVDPTRWVLTEPVDCLGETFPEPPFGLGIGIDARRKGSKQEPKISLSFSAGHPFLLTTKYWKWKLVKLKPKNIV